MKYITIPIILIILATTTYFLVKPHLETELPMGGEIEEAIVMPTDAKADLDMLSADLQKLGVESTSATNIEKYFKGETKTLTPNEANDWLEAVNKAKTDLRVTQLKGVKGKEDLINKLNWLINEAGKVDATTNIK